MSACPVRGPWSNTSNDMARINISYDIVTWNVRGLGSPTKRQKIHTYLNRRKAQIVCLQETHLAKGEAVKLQRRWRGQIFATESSAFARGALIWIRAGVPFEVTSSRIDKEGRWVLVHGRLDGQEVLIGSIYVPNQGQLEFLNGLSANLREFETDRIILGGDFNTILDIDLDRSTPPLRGAPAHRLAKGTLEWMEHWGLVDIWRLQHGRLKEYSYYSAVHDIHVRLDRIVCTRNICIDMLSSEYLCRTYSDHNPLKIRYNSNGAQSSASQWRFQPVMLEDQAFREDLAAHILEYFELNDKSTSSRIMEWEAFKVVLRGFCMSKTVGLRRELDAQLLSMEDRIRKLEGTTIQDDSTREAMREAKELYTSLVERLRCHDYKKYISRTHCEEGKANRMLARMITPEIGGSPITMLKTKEGVTVYTQEAINDTFYQYYQDLYKAPRELAAEVYDIYLDRVRLTQLPAKHREELGGPITLPEIKSVIQSMANNKTPGNDGLPVEFYKRYTDLLAPRLLAVYEEAWQEGLLPTSTREATIVPLPKAGRDALTPRSFRPLSMLTTDFKILSKILANRLNLYMRILVHPDQNGFIQTRSTALNLRRLYRVLEETDTDLYPRAMVLSMDLEQAFDSVSWAFLKKVMLRMGLGSNWVRWTTLLYSEPSARVRTGRRVSPKYGVCRGTRQGCPLSPLLFALAIEPLAVRARSEGVGRGIPLRDGIHTISLYADDLILYLKDVNEGLQESIELLQDFQILSGLGINMNKSYLFPVRSGLDDPPPNLGGLNWAPRTFKYLGIQIYHAEADLREGNLGKAIKSLKGQTKFWISLKLPIMSRITLTKMVVLPRLLYYFTNLPL